MNVAELIQELSKFDPELKVGRYDMSYYWENPEPYQDVADHDIKACGVTKGEQFVRI